MAGMFTEFKKNVVISTSTFECVHRHTSLHASTSFLFSPLITDDTIPTASIVPDQDQWTHLLNLYVDTLFGETKKKKGGGLICITAQLIKQL